MDIVTLLTPQRILLNQEISSTKRALEVVAQLLAHDQPQLSVESIFDAFISREKLGSTALGNGIAVPHARLAVTEPCAALLHCQEGLKVDSPDKKPVQLFLAILVPDETANTPMCGSMMADIALTFVRQNLNAAITPHTTPEELLAYLTQLFTHDLAA